MLTVNDGTTTREISFSEGVLLCGEKRLDGFTEVEKITFEKNSDMIKCILSLNDKNGNEEFSFVVSVRCASLASEKGGTR